MAPKDEEETKQETLITNWLEMGKYFSEKPHECFANIDGHEVGPAANQMKNSPAFKTFFVVGKMK
ncbi:hypothetical protein BLA29_005373 [Euroglyphus maynei]|uniref:Uncharacterized protein n=1 Tax=Euroglyphus maynei TaxID=6958 RepID=A0A1Y3AQ19_EURMA|nr:hypothetical protein BLA29_005373 [Euroglyphus maynei]